MSAIDMQVLEAAREAVQTRLPDCQPAVGAILGSGWSEVVDAFKILDEVPYEDIPGLGKPGVQGHAGVLSRVRYAGVESLIFQGRRHYYEGEGWTPVAIPLYLLRCLGARTLVITNAAGGLRPDLRPGRLMLITDHINMLGNHPLIGPHHEAWGPRFPDQSAVYPQRLRDLAERAAASVGEVPASGIYLATTGPTYETPAEIRMFRTLGADAVGMSTVPEAILANAANLSVLGISCITNLAAGISPTPLSHDEVKEASLATMPRMRAWFQAIWRGFAEEDV